MTGFAIRVFLGAAVSMLACSTGRLAAGDLYNNGAAKGDSNGDGFAGLAIGDPGATIGGQ